MPADVNASRTEVDDEQHEVANEAPASEHLHAEEVRGGDDAPMGLEERLPGHRLSPERSRLDAVLLEDALDGGPSKVDAQVLECAAKTCVSPRRILAGDRQQLPDFVMSGRWTARNAAGNTVLGAQVLDGLALAAPKPAGDQQNERNDSPPALRETSRRRSAAIELWDTTGTGGTQAERRGDSNA